MYIYIQIFVYIHMIHMYMYIIIYHNISKNIVYNIIEGS